MSDMLPNFLPALDAATEDALRESIKRFGVLVPVLVDQDGNVLDGHHRTRIAGELGVQVLRRTVHITDEQHARELVADVNDARRPRMDPEQRREIVAVLREKGHSIRAIAGAVGVPKSTVADDVKVSGPDTSPSQVVGQDGKRYPATRPVAVPDEPAVLPGQTAIPTPPATRREIEQHFAATSPTVAGALADRDHHATLVRVLAWCDRITATTRDLDVIDHGLSVVDRRSLESYVNSINSAVDALAAVQQVATARLSPVRSVS